MDEYIDETQDTKENVEKEDGNTEKIPIVDDNAENVKIIREWISTQAHLPQKNYINLIRRFLHCTDNDFEYCKKVIDLFYTLRSNIPEIYFNRDPTSPEIQEILKYGQVIAMPKYSKENYQIVVCRWLTDDPDKYDFCNVNKMFSMLDDIKMVEDDAIADGIITIFDLANLSTLRHLRKLSFSIMKKVSQYSEEAHPIKLKQLHYINAPSAINIFISLIKPILKKEVFDMIHFHAINSETLYDFVPKDLLPEELGGTIGNCEDMMKERYTTVLKWKDYLTDDGYWKVDESKRPVQEHTEESYLGVRGFFSSIKKSLF